MGVVGQCHALAAVPLANTRYPLNSRLGGPQCWSGQVQKSCPYRDLISGQYGLWQVPIQTQLSQTTVVVQIVHKKFCQH
jgi:hypothetical protein